MENRLRLYPGERPAEIQTPQQVSVKLNEILQPLAHAASTDRTFLNDFLDDDVRISADLYEVLITYGQLRRSA